MTLPLPSLEVEQQKLSSTLGGKAHLDKRHSEISLKIKYTSSTCPMFPWHPKGEKMNNLHKDCQWNTTQPHGPTYRTTAVAAGKPGYLSLPSNWGHLWIQDSSCMSLHRLMAATIRRVKSRLAERNLCLRCSTMCQRTVWDTEEEKMVMQLLHSKKKNYRDHPSYEWHLDKYSAASSQIKCSGHAG